MEHTLSVTKLCDYMANAYPLLKRDLLITAALLHDVGKTKELSSFPLNDYTDGRQLLGHIITDAQMIHELAKETRFSGNTGESACTLHSGTSRRTGIRFPEKAGTGRSTGTEFCRQYRCKTRDI